MMAVSGIDRFEMGGCVRAFMCSSEVRMLGRHKITTTVHSRTIMSVCRACALSSRSDAFSKTEADDLEILWEAIPAASRSSLAQFDPIRPMSLMAFLFVLAARRSWA